jgi:hypothetical protein
MNKPKHNNYRNIDNICPDCLSTLVLGNKGHFECSGDRLKLWETEFINYSKLDELQQNQFLIQFEDPNLFLYLYNKWEFKDQNGNRPYFICDYSNSINTMNIRASVIIPDPIMTKIIEKRLGRPLTEEEKRGEKSIWTKEGNYYTKYKKGRSKVNIPLITYPEEVS